MKIKKDHKIKIHKKLENCQNPFAMGDNKTLQDLIKFDISSPAYSPTIPTIFSNSVLKIINNKRNTITQQIVKNKKVIAKEFELPTFNNYLQTESIPIYKGLIKKDNILDMLFSNTYASFDIVDEDYILKELHKIKLPDDMLFDIEFQIDDEKLILYKKEIFKKESDNSEHYFGIDIPSKFQLFNSNHLYSIEHLPFKLGKNTSLEIHHYFNLDKLVYTTINPDPNMAYPAIIVTDLEHNPCEIHFTYKEKYISTEILDELKPNRLQDNYKDPNYFSKQDIEFLDMLRI